MASCSTSGESVLAGNNELDRTLDLLSFHLIKGRGFVPLLNSFSSKQFEKVADNFRDKPVNHALSWAQGAT